MDGSAPFLRLPARLAARRLALRQLDVATRELSRLHDPADEEALHDFRVAVRRLRSLLRAWKRELAPGLGRQHRAELRELQVATGEGRDSEVALEWIRSIEEHLGEAEREAVSAFVRGLEESLEAALSHARAHVDESFHRARAEISAGLDEELPPQPSPTLARRLRRLARREAKRLRRLLLGAGGRERDARLHSARISTKRLRYLVEPIRSELAEAERLVACCKRLQDVLGDLNDTAVLASKLERARAAALPEQAAGFDALTRLNAERRDELLARLDADWQRPGLAELDGELSRLRDALREVEGAAH